MLAVHLTTKIVFRCKVSTFLHRNVYLPLRFPYVYTHEKENLNNWFKSFTTFCFLYSSITVNIANM